MVALPKWKREGFATQWAYRKARAESQGYDLARQTRTRRYRKAQAEGFRSPAVRARIIKTTGGDPAKLAAAKKQETLDYFGVTESYIKRIRTLNRKHAAGQRDAQYMLNFEVTNSYRADIDERPNDWSIDRIGYILSYYGAVVNPASNYESLWWDERNQRGYLKNRKYKNGQPLSNLSQYKYLVEYGKLMSQDEFEQRYGANTPTKQASKSTRRFF